MEQRTVNNKKRMLGINGFGRIGKMTVWHHMGREYSSMIEARQLKEVPNEN